MSRIDRLLCTTEFDAHFPLAHARALARMRSDHTPIIWDSGEGHFPKKSRFKFEKWWITRPEFRDVVIKAWSLQSNSANVMDSWQARVRLFRRLAKGWSINLEADIRKHKKTLMEEYDSLDIKYESQSLSVGEKLRFEAILQEMNSHWIMEETKARQRSRDRDIVEGDRNTTYFHAMANQRRRKKLIHVLDGPEGPVTKIKDMLRVASEYYKNLFSKEDMPGIRLRQDFFTEEEKIKDNENELLGAPFTLEEIKEAVFSSYSDGAPGPDGLSFMLYQHFWDIVSFDLLEMFNAWNRDELDLYRLNFAMITLIPKEDDAKEMKKFRPISLLNCSFKIFTKVMTDRLATVIGRLIDHQQSAFIRGRFILESVVIAHEIIHEVHRKKQKVMVFKIDYEKAYDRVNLDFLYEILEARGFCPQFIRLIRQLPKEDQLVSR